MTPQSATPRRATVAGSLGFTFIEILMVMGIIAILTGMAVVVTNIWSRQGPEFRTGATVNKVASLVGTWKQKFERYPPSDATKIQAVAGGSKGIKSVPNRTNGPIESLFQAFYWSTFGVDPQLDDDELGNTDDEDSLDRAVTMQGKPLYEIIDNYGNPLVYFVHTEYVGAMEDPPSYITGEGEEVFPKPWKYEDEERGFAQPLGFQVYSMGPDGEPNTADDIKSW